MTKNNSFAGLTNEELVVIHARFKDHLDNMDKMLAEQAFMKNVNLSKTEGAVIKVPLSKEDAAKVQNSDYYLLTKRIVDKLDTVVEMIQESEKISAPTLNHI